MSGQKVRISNIEFSKGGYELMKATTEIASGLDGAKQAYDPNRKFALAFALTVMTGWFTDYPMFQAVSVSIVGAWALSTFVIFRKGDNNEK